MDLIRLESMNKYWKKHPPLHLMVQAFFGGESSESNGNNNSSGGDLLADLAAMGA